MKKMILILNCVIVLGTIATGANAAARKSMLGATEPGIEAITDSISNEIPAIQQQFETVKTHAEIFSKDPDYRIFTRIYDNELQPTFERIVALSLQIPANFNKLLSKVENNDQAKQDLCRKMTKKESIFDTQKTAIEGIETSLNELKKRVEYSKIADLGQLLTNLISSLDELAKQVGSLNNAHKRHVAETMCPARMQWRLHK